MRRCACSLSLHLGLCMMAVSVCVAATPAKQAAVSKPRSSAATPASECSGIKPDKEGWIALFDGTNLDAWQKPASDKWKIVDGVLTKDKRGGNLWTKDTFRDFTMELEVKCTKNTNSGVFLRGPVRGWHGLEVQILHPSGNPKPGKHDMGSLYDCVAPSLVAEKVLGEWNRMVITFVGNNVKVTLNDKLIIDANLGQWTEAYKNPDGSANKFEWPLKDLPKSGHIGLQDYGVPVWYRNIRVKRLDQPK